MSPYVKRYQEETGQIPPSAAIKLDPLFNKVKAGQLLPPKGQQAVDCGFTAHTFNDPQADPEIYAYYQWTMTHLPDGQVVHELSARIIGNDFICANIYQTDWPQPTSINFWQVDAILKRPLATHRAVVIENNGVFIWLLHRHPDWPLILQSGNDFNSTYQTVVANLSQRVHLAYLGDLDTRGLEMADRFSSRFAATSAESLSVLQNTGQIAIWLARYGRTDHHHRIYHANQIKDPAWQEAANFLEMNGQFVEQEQLIGEYERLIPKWLK